MTTSGMAHCVSLDQASRIVDAALVHGRAADAQSLTVVVLDSDIHAVGLASEPPEAAAIPR